MNEILMQMSDMRQVGDTVTMLSTTNDESYKKLGDLATQLVQSLTGTLVPREEEPVAATQWRCKVCGFAYKGDALPEGYALPHLRRGCGHVRKDQLSPAVIPTCHPWVLSGLWGESFQALLESRHMLALAAREPRLPGSIAPCQTSGNDNLL